MRKDVIRDVVGNSLEETGITGSGLREEIMSVMFSDTNEERVIEHIELREAIARADMHCMLRHDDHLMLYGPPAAERVAQWREKVIRGLMELLDALAPPTRRRNAVPAVFPRRVA